MGFLDSVERGLEKAVNGAFARTFRSGVQPVEIASGLRRELDIHSVIVDRDRVLTANQFTVRVSPEDAERLAQHGSTLTEELEGVINKHAREQGYQLLAPPFVAIEADDTMTRGLLQIDAAKPDNRVSWEPALEINGRRHPITRGTTTVGRGSQADIRIDDTGASRQHLQVVWDGKRAVARDLGSTNGSKVNGQRFSELTLEHDTVITIGQTSLRFRLVPAAVAEPSGRRSTPRAAERPSGLWEDL